MRRLAAVALLPVMVVALAACNGGEDGPEGDLADAFAEEDVVRLADVVEGDWKRFHAFPPFALPSAVDEALGFEWEGARSEDDEPRVTDDSYQLLVFTKGKTVVTDMVLSRCAAEFGAIPGVTAGISRKKAVFVVDFRTNDDACAVLRPAPRG